MAAHFRTNLVSPEIRIDDVEHHEGQEQDRYQEFGPPDVSMLRSRGGEEGGPVSPESDAHDEQDSSEEHRRRDGSPSPNPGRNRVIDQRLSSALLSVLDRLAVVRGERIPNLDPPFPPTEGRGRQDELGERPSAREEGADRDGGSEEELRVHRAAVYSWVMSDMRELYGSLMRAESGGTWLPSCGGGELTNLSVPGGGRTRPRLTEQRRANHVTHGAALACATRVRSADTGDDMPSNYCSDS